MFSAIQFLATSTKETHEVLLLGEEQMFWLDCSHLASQKLEEHPPSTMNRQITDGV